MPGASRVAWKQDSKQSHWVSVFSPLSLVSPSPLLRLEGSSLPFPLSFSLIPIFTSLSPPPLFPTFPLLSPLCYLICLSPSFPLPSPSIFSLFIFLSPNFYPLWHHIPSPIFVLPLPLPPSFSVLLSLFPRHRPQPLSHLSLSLVNSFPSVPPLSPPSSSRL